MKRVKNLLYVSFLSLGLLTTSCSDEANIEPIDDGNGGGEIPGSTDLTGSLEEDMTLDATQTYNLTGTFSVESGVTLTIPAGTEIVADATSSASDETEVYIVVQKGGNIEINGTADAPVVMRAASNRAGSWGGLVIAGNATTTAGTDAEAEVGGILYGGSDDADDSGSINYLVLKDAGASINPESQYNGLSLYAVGSETSIQNIALINGADDGVEFFGGSVSVTNLYLENNEDDAVDWTEGWNGSVTNTYVLHTIGNFSTAIEADGEDRNPKIMNFTAVSTTGGTALQFKKNSGATITGLSLSGYGVSVDIADDNRTDLTGIQINGAEASTDKSYNLTPTVDASTFDWIDNRGAVSVLPATIDADFSLDANTQYVLSGTMSVESGATLTIPAGTHIIADATATESDETEVYIVIQKGGNIEINGTEDAPVVMRAASDRAGSWGGLVIAGNANTTAGTDAEAEVGGILYGGSDDEDSSGSITYLILKDAGASINPESQYNGLSLYAVGAGTTVENIAILNGADDGVEFFGGTVSATNIYLKDNEDDAVDWTEGWNGTITNTYVLHTIGNFSTAIEADGENKNPQIVNFTAVSETGGTALQFKKNSGATITGLSLTGYDTVLDIADDTRTDLTGIQIEGIAATLEATYEVDASVDVSIFDWAN